MAINWFKQAANKLCRQKYGKPVERNKEIYVCSVGLHQIKNAYFYERWIWLKFSFMPHGWCMLFVEHINNWKNEQKQRKFVFQNDICNTIANGFLLAKNRMFGFFLWCSETSRRNIFKNLVAPAPFFKYWSVSNAIMLYYSYIILYKLIHQNCEKPPLAISFRYDEMKKKQKNTSGIVNWENPNDRYKFG